MLQVLRCVRRRVAAIDKTRLILPLSARKSHRGSGMTKARTVVILALPGVQLLDVSGRLDVFAGGECAGAAGGVSAQAYPSIG
jgi:hypothetical protein